MRALLDEYTRRYGRHHKAEATYDWVSTHVPQGMIRALQTPHPQCMPDDCKVKGNPVAAYRNYYNNYKRHMAKWKKIFDEYEKEQDRIWKEAAELAELQDKYKADKAKLDADRSLAAPIMCLIVHPKW